LRRGYRPITAAQTLSRRGRYFHVTFDDAYRTVANVLPELERLGVPSTIFVCTDLADDGAVVDIPELKGELASFPDELRTMTWRELGERAGRGLEIGSHGCAHAHFPRLDDEELWREVMESKQRIEDQIGAACRFLAYPFGDEDARVHRAVEAAGYEAAFALPGIQLPLNVVALPRVGVYRRDSALLRFAAKTSRLGRALASRQARR